jgi:hypothetical protein
MQRGSKRSTRPARSTTSRFVPEEYGLHNEASWPIGCSKGFFKFKLVPRTDVTDKVNQALKGKRE